MRIGREQLADRQDCLCADAAKRHHGQEVAANEGGVVARLAKWALRTRTRPLCAAVVAEEAAQPAACAQTLVAVVMAVVRRGVDGQKRPKAKANSQQCQAPQQRQAPQQAHYLA